MTVIGEAIINVRPNTATFKRDVVQGTKVPPQTVPIKPDVAGFRRGLGPIKAILGTLGVVGGATAGIQFFKSSISAASDLNESLSKSKVVFGDSAGGVEAFAKTAATSLGQSQQQALEAAATFGNLFTALGLGKPAAADMSQSIVTLAGDLASFNNVKPEDALIALRAGLVGETEPLRRFGVNINQASLQAEAASLGLIKNVKNVDKIKAAQNRAIVTQRAYTIALKEHGKGSTEALKAEGSLASANAALAKAVEGQVPPLTAAQKAQASYSLILKQTKTAQGDFGRTSGGLANQQRILGARFTDLKAKIGTALLPIVLKVVTGFQKAISVASGLGGTLSTVGGFIVRFKDVLLVAVAALAALKVAFLIQKAIIGMQAAFAGLNIVLAANPIGIVIVAIVALGAALVIAYQRSATFRAIVQAALAAVTNAARAVAEYFTKNLLPQILSAWSQIQDVVRAAIPVIVSVISGGVAFIQALWDVFGKTILTVVRTSFNLIRIYITTTINIVKGIVNVALDLLHGRWAKAFHGLLGIVRTVFDGIKATISTVLSGLVTVVLDLGGQIGSALWDGIKGAVSGIGDFGLAAVKAGINGLIGVVNSALNVIADNWPDVPGAPGPPFGHNAIPTLARGGIAFDPTLAVIGDNRGRGEAVIPLDRLAGILRDALPKQAAGPQFVVNELHVHAATPVDGRKVALSVMNELAGLAR